MTDKELTYEEIINKLLGNERKKGFLVNPTVFKILVSVEGEAKCMAEVNRETGITFSHLVGLINKYEGIEIIKTRRRGRDRECKLTDKGRKILGKLKSILENTKVKK